MPERGGRLVRRWVASLVLGLAYNCAVAPPSLSLPPPAAAQPAAAPAAVARPIERITFAEALARARTRNPNALVAAQEVQRAAALLAQVRSSSLPSVIPQASYTRLDGDRTIMGQTIQSADQIVASGGIGIPLVVPQQWAAWAQAADTKHVAELNVGAVQRQVAIAVGHAYLAVIAQHRIIAALVNARDNARAHADYARQQDQ